MMMNTKGNGLPLRKGPVRFAVRYPGGQMSNTWRIWEETAGDVYIKCRDEMREMKVSLHASGTHKIDMDTSGRERKENEIRESATPRWREPNYGNNRKPVPTYRLVFPRWGVLTDTELRDKREKYWRKNEIIIDDSGEGRIIVVNFYMLEEGMSFASSVKNLRTMAVLKGRPGIELHVLVTIEHEGDWKEKVKEAWSKAGMKTKLKRGNYTGWISGPAKDGGVYTVVSSAEITESFA